MGYILCVVTGQDTFPLSVSSLVQGLSGGHKSNIDSSLPIQCIWGQQFSCPQTLSMGLWVWWVTKWLNRELNGHSIRTGSLNTNSHDGQTLVCWTESEWTMQWYTKRSMPEKCFCLHLDFVVICPSFSFPLGILNSIEKSSYKDIFQR